ncbi:MAG: hypothetical protein IPO21_14195 [Bacteroidales bacterium]|nr:hypothetical protein [Bacteroidales bacterium]
MDLISLITSAILAFVMLGVGISLDFRNFKHIILRPKSLLLGLSIQVLLLPIIGIIICSIFPLSPELKIGIILLSICPGGTTSNFIVYLLNSNTELSIILTVLSSVLSLFFIPFILNYTILYYLGVDTIVSIPITDISIQILLYILIPTLVGIIIKEKSEKIKYILDKTAIFTILKRKIELNYLKIITLILLALMFSIKLFADESAGGVGIKSGDFKAILLPVFLLNLIGILAGFLIPYFTKSSIKNAVSISIQIGLQNTTMAFLIATTVLKNNEMQKPALIYAFFSFWSSILIIIILKQFFTRRIRKKAQLKIS